MCCLVTYIYAVLLHTFLLCQIIWAEQQLARVRQKRSTLSKNLTPADRANENEAYNKMKKAFNDPMWTAKQQDWYMVRLASFKLGLQFYAAN